MSAVESLLFLFILLGAVGFFLRNLYRLFAMICLGGSENRFDRLWLRFRGMLVYAFGQVRVVSEGFGLNHLLLFWGFMFLLLMNLEFLVSGIFPRFSFWFLGDFLYGSMRFMADIMSVVVLACVVNAVIRRIFFRPAHIDPTADAFLILTLVAVLMIAYFGYHASEIRLGGKAIVPWTMPVSYALAPLFQALTPEATHLTARAFWWLHALVLLFFLNYLPYSKHLHILTAIPNIFFRSASFVNTVPRMVFRRGERFGVSKIVQYSWKDLLDFLSCTECGRCQAACPAYNTQKPLNPKQVIHSGKLNLLANGRNILASRPSDTLASAPAAAEMTVPLIDTREESISVDAIWSCTTCGACMQKCPVFIEHVPKLISLRRHLVMEKAAFPEELIAFFENSEQRFNPWGIAPNERDKWIHDRDIKILSHGCQVEYLFYVGCSGSFDPRNRMVTAAVAKILNAARLSWGVLGNEEKCCGDSLRRLGNEYAFDILVKSNIEIFKKYGIKKIITYCPHCFSTLKNDYKQYGVDFEVMHHSQLIHKLLQSGVIKLKEQLEGSVTYHDSCYLGRYNNLYKEPREIIRMASGGKSPVEMGRHHADSFCCGAGGGRMWLEENLGSRIYLERTKEALATKASIIGVACPYCMTMFEDGLKDEKASEQVAVKDIAEIVAEKLA
ncbi:MAG: (Fe-S)-binding protein [Syntrophaceae bacterium]|nr:(Fe-S)-binding protein [Syntrophaceae bacterium]